MGPDHVEPWKWPNSVRKAGQQMEEDLSWKVPGTKLRACKDLRVKVKIYPSTCDSYPQYQFMREMHWLTVFIINKCEMWHVVNNERKIHQSGDNLWKSTIAFFSGNNFPHERLNKKFMTSETLNI